MGIDNDFLSVIKSLKIHSNDDIQNISERMAKSNPLNDELIKRDSETLAILKERVDNSEELKRAVCYYQKHSKVVNGRLCFLAFDKVLDDITDQYNKMGNNVTREEVYKDFERKKYDKYLSIIEYVESTVLFIYSCYNEYADLFDKTKYKSRENRKKKEEFREKRVEEYDEIEKIVSLKVKSNKTLVVSGVNYIALETVFDEIIKDIQRLMIENVMGDFECWRIASFQPLYNCKDSDVWPTFTSTSINKFSCISRIDSSKIHHVIYRLRICNGAKFTRVHNFDINSQKYNYQDEYLFANGANIDIKKKPVLIHEIKKIGAGSEYFFWYVEASLNFKVKDA